VQDRVARWHPTLRRLIAESDPATVGSFAFTAAIRLRTSDGHINSATIAYGGVAPTVVRLPRTESFLAGKPIALGTFEEAGRIARGEVAPISDVRGSAEYRAQLAENILPKFYYDAFSATSA